MQTGSREVTAHTPTNSIEPIDQNSHMAHTNASSRSPETTQPTSSLLFNADSNVEEFSLIRRESKRNAPFIIDQTAESQGRTRHVPVTSPNYSIFPSTSTSTGLTKAPKLGLSTSISENTEDNEDCEADYIRTPTSPVTTIMRRPSLAQRPHTAPTPVSPHSAPGQRAPFYDQPSPKYKSRLILDVNPAGTIEPDKLPAYAPTVQLLALCRRKREMKSTKEKARRRNWEVVWLLLDGTALRIYTPTSAERSRYEKAWDAKYGRKGRANAMKNKDNEIRSRKEESRSRSRSGREIQRSPSGMGDETDYIDEGDETDDAEMLEEVPGSSTIVQVTHPRNPANPSNALGDRGRQSSIQKTPWEPIHSGSSRRPRTAPAIYTSPIEMSSPPLPLGTPSPHQSQPHSQSASSYAPSSQSQSQSSSQTQYQSLVPRNPLQRHATPNFNVDLDIAAVPKHPSLSDIISRKPYKSYAIRHAICTRATTYFKRNFVLRFILEDGKQFLVQMNEWQETLWWLQLMRIATPLALDLDERPMPEPPQYPRRARPTTAPGSIEASAVANIPPEYFISSDAPRSSIDNEALY